MEIEGKLVDFAHNNWWFDFDEMEAVDINGHVIKILFEKDCFLCYSNRKRIWVSFPKKLNNSLIVAYKKWINVRFLED